MDFAQIRQEWSVFAREGDVSVGAVRDVARDHLVVYIEGYGDQIVTRDQVASAHDGKVVLNPAALPEAVQAAIAHAHDAEDRIQRDRPPLDEG